MKDKIDNNVNIICLTPVKNEAWILELFLKSTSLWADYIIVADQSSDDGSREIVKKYSKAILIKNESKDFSESSRQKLLIAEGRKISGKKLFIALDADEILTGNFTENIDWQEIKNLKEGTVINFNFANILPEKGKYWSGPHKMPWGFVDNGIEHVGEEIHSNRLPLPKNYLQFSMDKTMVMHYQFADWQRMESKHRWYQCWEHINDVKKSSIAIYRQYHHMNSIKKSEFKDIPADWKNEYEKKGVDLNSFVKEKEYRWDKCVLEFLREYPDGFFNRIDIWQVDWSEYSKSKSITHTLKFEDRRSFFDKALFRYLEFTQKYHPNFMILVIDRLLKIFIK